MARRRTRAVDPWKLKKWYKILAPAVWGEKEVGETAASEPDKLIGRKVDVPASDMTGSIGHAHYLLLFQINKVVGEKAFTDYVGHYVDSSFVKRMTRRHTSKVEHVFDVVTRDGKKIHVKATTWTAVRAPDSRRTEIRKIMEQFLRELAEKKDKDEFLRELVVGDVTKKIAEEAKKLVPIRRVEVTKAVLIREERGQISGEVVEEAVAEAEA